LLAGLAGGFPPAALGMGAAAGAAALGAAPPMLSAAAGTAARGVELGDAPNRGLPFMLNGLNPSPALLPAPGGVLHRGDRAGEAAPAAAAAAAGVAAGVAAGEKSSLLATAAFEAAGVLGPAPVAPD
jgi:hypothetical protein